jgi:hypothetical protein
MDQKVVYGLVERLALKPIEGSKLAIFLSRLTDQSGKSNDASGADDQQEAELIDGTDQAVINFLKRLQVITLTKPILNLCVQAQTPSELSRAKSAGIESIIDIPVHISAKLNSLGTTLEQSLKNFTDIKEAEAEELNRKFNLVVPPSGLEISVVITIVVSAFTMLAFILLKADDMLGSSEAYWGFFAAGIMILLGINAVVINLIKVLRFKKNRDSIFAEAKRKFVEGEELKHSKLKRKVEDEGFQIQKREYSKAAELMFKELDKEEEAVRKNLNA